MSSKMLPEKLLPGIFASGLGLGLHAIILILLLLQVVSTRAAPLQLKSFLSSSNDALRARCFSRDSTRKLSTFSTRSSSSRDPVLSLGQLTTAYYMQTKIGTPPREVLLLVDTGSELTWVQCDSCVKCSPTRVPPFNPGASSSFFSEPCTSSVCGSGRNFGFQSACDRSTGECSFQVAYLDGSEASGIIAREIFSLQSRNGTASRLPGMIFGCASRDFQNPVDFSSGTLGLNRGSFSFPAQIGSRKGLSEKFSYCFPNRAQHLNASGVIIFGETGVPPELMSYIPLQQEPAIANIIDFYYVDLVGISVEGELLGIPSSAFTIDGVNGNGGTYFDSGTTVSFLVEPAHRALLEAFERRVSSGLNRSRGSDFRSELCYEIRAGEPLPLPPAPLVVLHFRTGVEMELQGTSLWVPLTRTPEVVTVCLAFLNAGAVSQGGVNVIGNYQQQDFLIEHDLKHSRIGFAPANCVVD